MVAVDSPSAIAPDDVLAQPTRARLFALLGDLKRSAGTVELAEELGLHPNGVRIHLERLEEAGLVERARVRGQRGRPPDAWRVAPGAQPGGDAPHAYRDLGRWLARAFGAGARGTTGIEATGREIGRELAPGGAAAVAEAFETSLAALGFQPTVTGHDGDRTTFCLGNCPYRDAVTENQPAICALHRGVTRGLLEVLEPEAKLTGFVPRDPVRAGCTIEVRGLDPASRPGGPTQPVRGASAPGRTSPDS
jgi:predicted ArsR family transcriptional regulator